MATHLGMTHAQQMLEIQRLYDLHNRQNFDNLLAQMLPYTQSNTPASQVAQTIPPPNRLLVLLTEE